MRGRRRRRNIGMPVLFNFFLSFFKIVSLPPDPPPPPPIKRMLWKWFHTLSRKAPVGLRFIGLLSRMMDSAPRK